MSERIWLFARDCAREADIDLSRQLLKLARDRKAAGIATGLDVTREEVQLENNNSDCSFRRMNRKVRAQPNPRPGISFDVRLTLTDELKFVLVEPERTEAALTTAREQQLELRAQENRQKLVALSFSSVASERLPSVSLNGDYGWIGVKPEDAPATRFGVLPTSPSRRFPVSRARASLLGLNASTSHMKALKI